ncbi:MAG: enoyl-CoA hydratase/isomerase family protein [Mycobacterium sp.]
MDGHENLLVTDKRGPVLYAWLNRPNTRNALDDAMLEAITALFTSVQKRFDIRVVVLGGRGPAFCAGADRRSPPGVGGDSERARHWASQIGRRAIEAILDCDVITIARVHGPAIGGGAALALACDFRIGSSDVRLRLPEVDLGMPLAWAVLPRLIEEVGAARARELVMLGDEISPERAEHLSLLHRVVPGDALDAEVDALAGRLADKPEFAIRTTKMQFRAYRGARSLGVFTETDDAAWARGLATDTARRAFGPTTTQLSTQPPAEESSDEERL